MSNVIDATHLQKPVNVFKWNAAQIKQILAQVPPNTPAHAELSQSVAWLEHLGTKIDYKHTNPVILLTVGNISINRADRHKIKAVLEQIDAAEQEAFAAHGKQSSWATVEP